MRNIIFLLSFYLVSIPCYATGATFEKTLMGDDREIVTTGAGHFFSVFEVPEDGNCAFHALNTTRERILEYAMQDADDEKIQFLLFPEMLAFYGDGNIELTQENVLNFLATKYMVEGKETISQEQYLDCVEHYPESGEDVQTGLIDCIAEFLGITINVWRRGDDSNQIVLSRRIEMEDAIASYNLLYETDSLHFKMLLNKSASIEETERCLGLELEHFAHYCQVKLKMSAEQIQEILSAEDDGD